MRKKVVIIIVFTLLLLVPYYAFLGRDEITRNYRVNDHQITETYFFNDGFYQIVIDDQYFVNIPHRRISGRIVTSITRDDNCLEIGTLTGEIEICGYEDYFVVGEVKEVASEFTNIGRVSVANDIEETLIYWDYKNLNIIRDGALRSVALSVEDYDFIGTFLHGNLFLYLEPNITTFSRLRVADINNGRVQDIDLNDALSTGSYFLGAHRNLVYIFDPVNANLFTFNVRNHRFNKERIRNDAIAIYRPGGWTYYPIHQMNRELLFNQIILDDIVFNTNGNFGNYRHYGKYILSRLNESTLPKKVHTDDNIRFLKAIGDNYYYISGNELKRVAGGEVKTLLKYNELRYNPARLVFVSN